MAQFSKGFTHSSVQTIGVYTSGGDAPGMNAAVRSVVRSAIYHKLQVKGILRGYTGLLTGEIIDLNRSSVANVIQRGGTILKTGRSKEFLEAKNRQKAAQVCQDHQLDALVCIGGDGSFRGAQALWQEHKIPIVGVPGTIDNDIYGTDATIGYDTAVNTALEAIDRIRDTAASHDRLFLVEVMGRNSGFIAIDVGVAGGAENVFIPESEDSIEDVVEHIQKGIQRGKSSSILIAAEGPTPGKVFELREAILKKSGFDAKVCILGHIQRGGSPSARDRILASQLGAAAVDHLKRGLCNGMVGLTAGQITFIDFADTLAKKKTVPADLIELAQILSI